MSTRKAIITGSIKYNKSPLNFPDKDIDLMSKILEKRCKLNTSDITTILHDKSDDDSSFIEKIKKMCQKIEKERKNVLDLIVFYYSGHGTYRESEGMSYIQISDDEFISINEIINVISTVNAKNKYFIIDACQSGGFSVFSPKGKTHRQFTVNSEGIYCLFGTTEKLLAFEPTLQQAIKKEIKNSYYTHFIIEALNKKINYIENTISIKAVDNYATMKTASYTDFQQIPVTTTQTSGYFPFGFWEEDDDLFDIKDWESKKTYDIKYSNNQELAIVDSLIETIHAIYNDNFPFAVHKEKEFLNNLSQPAIDILNERLALKNKKLNGKPLINGLIANNNRNFLNLLLENHKLEIDLTLLDKENRTALIEAIESNYEYSYSTVESLFSRGYKLHSLDKIYIQESLKDLSISPQILENVSIAHVCSKFRDKISIDRFWKIRKIIYTLLSFQLGRIIGYKFNNHLAVANNFFYSHKPFGSLFLKAVKVYGFYDNLVTKPSFVAKEKEFLVSPIYQDKSYDDMLSEVFPELFTD